MVDEITIQIVVFLAAMTGGFTATMLPYWQKLRDYIEAGNRDLKFEYKFIGTAALAVVTSVAISFSLFDTLISQVPAGATVGAIFIQVALTTFGLNTGANQLMKSTRTPEKK